MNVLGFLLKHWKEVLILVLIALLSLFIKLYFDAFHRYNREKNNADILMDTLLHYKNKSGEEVARIGVLEFEIEDYKRRCEEDMKMIKDLNLKLKNVQSSVKVVTETKIEYRDSLIYVRDSTFNFEKHDKWYDLCGTILMGDKSGSIDINLQTRDSLSFIVHSVPKCKLFGWGVKGYEVDVISHNPNSHISYVRWVNVEKKKKAKKKK